MAPARGICVPPGTCSSYPKILTVAPLNTESKRSRWNGRQCRPIWVYTFARAYVSENLGSLRYRKKCRPFQRFYIIIWCLLQDKINVFVLREMLEGMRYDVICLLFICQGCDKKRKMFLNWQCFCMHSSFFPCHSAVLFTLSILKIWTPQNML